MNIASSFFPCWWSCGIGWHFISYLKRCFSIAAVKKKKLYSALQIWLHWAVSMMEAIVLNTFAYGTFYCKPRKPICTARACKYYKNVNALGASTTDPSTEHYPVPVSSEFGGVLSISHTVFFSSHRSSSAPSSSQSWSPLHTRDRLMHWPKSEQKCRGKEVFVHLKINHLNQSKSPTYLLH